MNNDKQFAPLFPEIEPYRSGMLAVDAEDTRHTLYWEESGNPHGVPVLFLHGGPGSGTLPKHRRFFDPQHYRIVLFDQRGAGKSTPHGEYRNNTTPLLIADIEKLRVMLGISRWLVFGGSWGSTLTLAYAEAHAERCLGLIVRGIFLCTKPEVDWWVNRMGQFYPEVHAQFAQAIPASERGDLLQAYAKRLFSDDVATYTEAARVWSWYEGCCEVLQQPARALADFAADATTLGKGRMEAHYMSHAGFMEEDQLINNIDKIRHLPAMIIQGRYDVICPPVTAYRLHQAWPEAAFQFVGDAGHSAFEPGVTSALVRATEQFRIKQTFE